MFREMADEHPDADTGDVNFILKEQEDQRPVPQIVQHPIGFPYLGSIVMEQED